MLDYLLRRLLITIPTLVAIPVICFMLTWLSGDPSNLILPMEASDEARAAFRQAHGLDQPVITQLWRFMLHAVTGDFGMSLRFGEPATLLVVERLAATTELAIASLALAVIIGVPAGVVAAYRRNSAADRIIRGAVAFSQAVPAFYLAVLSVILFAVWLRWLPTGGRGTWQHLVLPSVTLASGLCPLIARVTRSAMLDELRRDYVRTARAKGLREGRVVWLHSLRNAIIPVVTVIGLQIGALMSGVVVTETVFAWPGVGRLAIQAIYARDFPVVQAVVFFFAIVFVVVNILVDVVYAAIDPRIRY